MGIGHAGYFTDSGEFMEPYSEGGNVPVPVRTWIETHGNQMSINGLAPYITGAVAGGPQTLTDVWKCPSNNDRDESIAFYWPLGWMDMWYSYFGRSETWAPGTASHPNEIMQNEPESHRLLMNDTVFRWGGGGGQWNYNHGVSGPSDIHAGTSDALIPRNLNGSNQLHGDGHVMYVTLTTDQVDPAFEETGYVILAGVDYFFYGRR